MTDDLAPNTADTLQKPRGKPFKQGFDERRWNGGSKNPRVPKDVKKLFDHLIWDVLSEEIEHPITHKKTDRFRLMLRSMTTSKQSADKQAEK
jgi:hypothetical protein